MRFQLKQYDHEAVAYDTASGDTHYLAPLALTLFQLCGEFPRLTREDIACLLLQHYAIEPDSPPIAQIDDTLDDLCRVGLIQLG